MGGKKTIWEDNSPDSLVELSARCVLQHPYTIFYSCDCASRRPTTSSRREDVISDDDVLSYLCCDGHCLGHPSGRRPAVGHRSTHKVDYKRPSPRMRHDSQLRLLPSIQLPQEICEKLLNTMYDEGLDLDDNILMAFGDICSTRLKHLNLRHSSLTDRGLASLLRHNVRELDLVDCPNITPKALAHLNKYSESLVELAVGGSGGSGFKHHIFSRDSTLSRSTLSSWGKRTWIRRDDGRPLNQQQQHHSISSDEEDEEGFYSPGEEDDCLGEAMIRQVPVINAPNLQKLYMMHMVIGRSPSYLPGLFLNLKSLTHLDMSCCGRPSGGLGDLGWLPAYFKNTLVYLVLYNVGDIKVDAVKNIVKLSKLRHLDIGHDERFINDYEHPYRILKTIVESLPDLSSLDISGTNLAGTGVYGHDIMEDEALRSLSSSFSCEGPELPKCDIPGLISRVDRPLDFLGLYRTSRDASLRAHIPAKEISGDLCESQILVAGRRYVNRPTVMEKVLNDLFHIFRYETCSNYRDALDVILFAMDRHPGAKVIQIAGAASLYYIVNGDVGVKMNAKVKRKLLSTILNAMFAHKDDQVMMRNCCLTLCQFRIPQDVMFDYRRLVQILLYVVSQKYGEESNFVQRAAICLLNALACHIDRQQKLLVGDLGAIKKMLSLIFDRLQAKNCDEVMETAWSMMWNVTDETPVNCQRFLDGGGMKLFLHCKEEFPKKNSLLRNMMGLLGNVAEVPQLRPKLMTEAFVSEFLMLLDSNLDGIEVSYNAAGVLAHMASDGTGAWTIEHPSREEVLSRMVNAIESWNLNTERSINYRSFEPILRLVRVAHTPQCQHWAVWALANLTNVDADKYCNLVDQEGGLEMLEELINRNIPEIPYQRVIELANVVRNNVARWKEGCSAASITQAGGSSHHSAVDSLREDDSESSESFDFDG